MMAEAAPDEADLPEGWEAVIDDDGRTYWWNVDTNETTWTKPEKIVAKKGIASGYVAKLAAEQPAAAAPRRGPDCSSGGSGVASLAKRFSGMSTAPAATPNAPKQGAGSGSAPTTPASSGDAPPDLEKRSSALSVDAMKKYNEAKAKMREKEGSNVERKAPIDLTK